MQNTFKGMVRSHFAKSSINIPSFPIWEFVILAFVFLAGVRGLVGTSMAYIALGTVGAFAWHITLVLMPIVSIIGLFMWPPNGIIVTMVSKMILCVGCLAVYAGLAVAAGMLFYPGATALLIFGIGAGCRVVQLRGQLTRLSRIYSALTGLKRGNEWVS